MSGRMRTGWAAGLVLMLAATACGPGAPDEPAATPAPETSPDPTDDGDDAAADGCGGVDLADAPAEPVTIRIGHGDATDAPLFVQFLAVEEAGLEHYGSWYTLEAQQFSPPDRLAAYQAGALDAGTAAAPQLLTAIQQGLNIGAVASLAVVLDDDGETYAYSYLALEESGINGPEDLTGKKIGIIAPNTSTEYWVLSAVQKAGLDPQRDIELVSVPPPTAEEALRTGQVDVQFFSDAFYGPAVESGGVVEVFDALTGPGFDQEFLSIWFDRDFVAENPGVYCAWAADYETAIDFYVNQPAEALAVLIEEGYNPAPSVEAALAAPRPGRKVNGHIDRDNFHLLIDDSVETGFLNLTITADDVFIEGYSLTE